MTPTLFYDEKGKTGYTIQEYQSFASPEYNLWFFEIGGAKYNKPKITEMEFMGPWFEDSRYVLASIGDKKYGTYNVNLAEEEKWQSGNNGPIPYCELIYMPKTEQLTIQNKTQTIRKNKDGYYERDQKPAGKKVTLKTDNLEEIQAAVNKYLQENPLSSI